MEIITLYNDSQRKDTTGNYITKIIDPKHKIKHIQITSSTTIDSNDSVFLLIDDGYNYNVKVNGSPLIYWAIDTHITMDQCILKSKNADYVFAAQKDGAETLGKLINKKVEWLPLACDIETHHVWDFKKEYDITFIGNTKLGLMDTRIKYLDVLFKNIGNFFYGQKYFQEASKIYGKSKIVFNCSINNDINMRVFEALCSGSLLITDNLNNNGMKELGLIDGENVVLYNNEQELIDKVKYYLTHDHERELIGSKGKQLVIDNHTYKHRLEKILDIIEK